MTTTEKPKRGRGRPPEYTMPERIDASPEEIARKVLSVPVTPEKKWRYMEGKKV